VGWRSPSLVRTQPATRSESIELNSSRSLRPGADLARRSGLGPPGTCKSFRLRSYRKCAPKSFRIRSYENTQGVGGGWGSLFLAARPYAGPSEHASKAL